MAEMIVRGCKVKVVDHNSFEGLSKNGKYDFIVTKDKNYYFVDIFKNEIKEANHAHVDSFLVDSLDDAVKTAFNFEQNEL